MGGGLILGCLTLSLETAASSTCVLRLRLRLPAPNHRVVRPLMLTRFNCIKTYLTSYLDSPFHPSYIDKTAGCGEFE